MTSTSYNEGGTISITIAIVDSGGVTIPIDALIDPKWTLIRKTTGEVLDCGDITDSVVVLTLDQLQLYDAVDDGVRIFGIEATYDSFDLGDGLGVSEEEEFTITNLVTQPMAVCI